MAVASTTTGVPQEGQTALAAATVRQRSLWGDAFRRLIRNRLSLVGLVIFIVMVVCAVAGPVLAPYPYQEQDLLHVAEGPTWTHLFGTDDLGRDMFSRILWGARTAGIVAISATSLSLILGVLLGALAAYRGGWVEVVVSRVIDIAQSIPDLLFAAMVAATVRQPTGNLFEWLYAKTSLSMFRSTAYADYIVVFGALSLIHWPGYARLIRGQILSLREKEYVAAARSVGLTSRQILTRHLLPNAMGPIVVQITFGFAGAIIAESGLSFLGVGIQPPQASWGAMINDNRMSWAFRPWLTVIPGVVLAVVALGINFLGDGLNDALNPRQGRRGGK
jgi:ABC-type dipeptide/oligopeptide/nickel transport system permease subunit